MTLTKQELRQSMDAHSARIALLALIGSHLDGVTMIVNTLGPSLPDSVLAEIEGHRLSCHRALKAIEAE